MRYIGVNKNVPILVAERVYKEKESEYAGFPHTKPMEEKQARGWP